MSSDGSRTSKMSERVVLVTGGGRGIGRAICQRFARDGCRVMAVARSADELAETKHLIETDGGVCSTQAADLGVCESVREMIDTACKRYGRIDVLINNAGIAPRAAIDAFDPATFDVMMNINVHAVFAACKYVWPIMTDQGDGAIVNLSSAAAVDPFPGFGPYGASKAWVNAFTRALADEGREHGIRVYAVAPGAVETRMLRGPFPDFPPDQTLAPADVADLVYGVADPTDDYTSGQVINICK